MSKIKVVCIETVFVQTIDFVILFFFVSACIRITRSFMFAGDGASWGRGTKFSYSGKLRATHR